MNCRIMLLNVLGKSNLTYYRRAAEQRLHPLARRPGSPLPASLGMFLWLIEPNAAKRSTRRMDPSSNFQQV